MVMIKYLEKKILIISLQNKVESYKKAKLNGFANSIKYSDYVLGKFVQILKDKGLMKNTIVAYKILALIVSDDYAKKDGVKYNKIVSQIDFAYLLKNKIIILKPNKINQGLSYIKGASYLYDI
jgi:hypothetical protein